MFVFSYLFVYWIESDTSISLHEYLIYIMEKQHYKYYMQYWDLVRLYIKQDILAVTCCTVWHENENACKIRLFSTFTSKVRYMYFIASTLLILKVGLSVLMLSGQQLDHKNSSFKYHLGRLITYGHLFKVVPTALSSQQIIIPFIAWPLSAYPNCTL